MATLRAADLLSQSQAAEFLNVRPQTLSIWRCLGRYHLPYVKVGRLVRYTRADLEKFIESRTVTHTGEGDRLSAGGN